jgi:inorganic pyrophosphatase
MNHPLHDIEPGSNPPHELNLVVEIPRGSRNKYEIDKKSGMMRLDRLLYSAIYYPGDYGFVPRTLAADGDPLDVVCMVTVPTFSGCLIEVRPIGLFLMDDEKGPDEKVLAVPVRDPLYAEYQGLEDVPAHFLKEMEHFFRIYKDLEEEKKSIIYGWRPRADVEQVVEQAICRYADQGTARQ